MNWRDEGCEIWRAEIKFGPRYEQQVEMTISYLPRGDAGPYQYWVSMHMQSDIARDRAETLEDAKQACADAVTAYARALMAGAIVLAPSQSESSMMGTMRKTLVDSLRATARELHDKVRGDLTGEDARELNDIWHDANLESIDLFEGSLASFEQLTLELEEQIGIDV